jgi:hypothetical protein
VPSADRANLESLAAGIVDLGARLRNPGEPRGVGAPLDADLGGRVAVVTLFNEYGPLDVMFHPERTDGYADLAFRAVRRPIGDHLGVWVARQSPYVDPSTTVNKDICAESPIFALLVLPQDTK